MKKLQLLSFLLVLSCGLIAGKQAGDATALTEIKATGAGSGTYDPTTDSTEALRDRGDSAWTTATGFAAATLFTGITSVAEWLGLLAGK